MAKKTKDSKAPPAPVVLFVYNRPEHTRKTVEALARNTLAWDSELWIFSDAAKDQESVKKVDEVRNYIHSLVGSNRFTNVYINEVAQNKGLAKSIIEGVSQVMQARKRVIVLEDDLVTAPDFLVFMNECLNFYKSNQEIGSITGFSPLRSFPKDYHESVYIVPRNSSHGWATWLDRWQRVDWKVGGYDKFRKNILDRWCFDRCGSDRSDRLRRQMSADIDSWSIRFGYWQFRQGMYTVYPTVSRVHNIGWDGSGVHAGNANYKNDLPESPISFELTFPSPDIRIIKQLRKIYSGGYLLRLSRTLRNNGLGRLDKLFNKLITKLVSN